MISHLIERYVPVSWYSSTHGCPPQPLPPLFPPLQNYTSVKQDELRQFLLARLRIFYEEELDVPLVL